MQLRKAIFAAALASSAAAAPSKGKQHNRSFSKPEYARAPVSHERRSDTSPAGLSLTQQLFIADTAVDRFALLPKDEDFIFNFDVEGPGVGAGGNLVAANRATFPALVSTGAGMAVGRIDPCGINTFHVHPRSAELQIVVQGRLITEMVPENGVMDPNDDTKRRVIRTELGKFDLTPFYQGSVHTQFNPDCEEAVFVAAFADEDFGAGQIADELFSFDDDLIVATLGGAIDGKDVDRIRDAIPPSIALGVDECLNKCGIKKND